MPYIWKSLPRPLLLYGSPFALQDLLTIDAVLNGASTHHHKSRRVTFVTGVYASLVVSPLDTYWEA